jgi:uncharacterized protein YecE (DUF72 family)
MQLYVGRPTIVGDIARYAKTFNMLELRAEPGKVPKPGRLSQWPGSVAERFAFSVMLPAAVSVLDDSPGAAEALTFALRVAEALRSQWIVLQTPPSITPSSRARQRLKDLIQRLPRDERKLAWEPRGPWEEEDMIAFAADHGLHLVRDLTRDEVPVNGSVYTRLRALGGPSRLSAGMADRLVDNFAGAADAYVVIEGDDAGRFSRLLRAAVRDSAGQLEDADELDDSDELEDSEQEFPEEESEASDGDAPDDEAE